MAYKRDSAEFSAGSQTETTKVLGLLDDFLRLEMKRRVKEDTSLSFVQVMQAAITWSEEEETQTIQNPEPVSD